MPLIAVLVLLGAAPPKAAEKAPEKTASRPAADAGTVLEAPDPTDLTPMIGILSTSDGGFPFAKYKWQVPDLQGWVEVPSVQVVNGLPVRFSAALSRHDIPYLMDFYGKEFTRAGLYLPPPDDAKALGLGDRFFQLTGLDTDNLISYTVMFQQVDRNLTTVIMSQGYLQEWLKKTATPAGGTDFAPLFPNATLVVRSRSEDMDLLSFGVTASPAEVMTFYRETLGRAGFQPSDSFGVFQRGREQIKVSATKTPPGRPGAPPTAVVLQRRAR